ncbi:MAG: gas vesicle protein GvpO [Thermodesulfovibrionales bacterium]|nr:gas vesicle protein GvpO [Thermodesulfovibrionales bacterium]
MTKVEEVDRVVNEFLKKTLKVEDDRIRIIRTARANDGWDADVEVIEDSLFIKSLGIPAKVKDRKIYTVNLDADMEILSFERHEPWQRRENSL